MSEEEKNSINEEELKESSEKEEKKNEKKEAKKEKEKLEFLEKQLDEMTKRAVEFQDKYEAADKEKDDWKNKYYTCYADMSNVRKQVEKENADFKKYAARSLIEELIPTLDAFDMALKNEPADPVVKNYVQGFKMIHNKLLYTLKQVHVEIIDPQVGEDYDPTTMQAFSTVEGEEDNKVADSFTKGYKLYEYLLRPAGVIITKKAEKEEKKEETNTEEKTSDDNQTKED